LSFLLQEFKSSNHVGVTNCKKSPFYYKNLFDCTHVWIRDDSVHKAFQPPYTGPFRIINRINDHLFNIDVAGKFINISTKRLKPAFLPKDPDSSVIIPTSSPVSSSQNTLKTYLDPKKKVQFATSTVARGRVL